MITCAIIPAYNEANTIGDIIQKTKNLVDDIIVIDDASTDETSIIAKKFGAKVLKHNENLGSGAAIRTGYQYALLNNYSFIVQIDADGQHDPFYIPMMLEKAKYCDMVIGSRLLNESIKSYSLVRRLGIKFFSILISLCISQKISDVTSGYRVYTRECLKKIWCVRDRFWIIEQTIIAGRLHMKIECISTPMPVRKYGQSQLSFWKIAKYPFVMTGVILGALFKMHYNKLHNKI